MNQEVEEWRPIPAYEGLYEASSLGRIRSLTRVVEQRSKWGGTLLCRKPGRILRPVKGSDGYLGVSLSKDGRILRRHVHALVCSAFHGPRPEGHHAAHNDGAILNCHATNVRWATPTENADDKVKHGTLLVGQDCGNAKLSEDQVLKIKEDRRSVRSIARQYGISPSQVSNIRRGLQWKHLT